MIGHDELLDLAIAHVDCDAFYSSVEKRDDPSLLDRPVLVGHPGGRGVVAAACYVARRYGIRSAMPMYRALELCPDAVVIRPDMAKYREASRQIRIIFLAATPIIEPVALDEAYLDLSLEVRHDPRVPALLLAEAVRRIETEVGVTASVGLAPNKFLAKIASDLDKPRGFAVIGRADAESVLASLPVRRIPGIGPVTAVRMADEGVTLVADLQRMDEAELVTRYGSFGRQLARLAHGKDESRVTPHRPAKSLSAETTFARDLRAYPELEAELQPLCARVAERLRRAGRSAMTVVLKLKTADFQVHTRQRRLADPTRREEVIRENAATLLAREADGRAFRLIGVGVADLQAASAADPPGLFDPG